MSRATEGHRVCLGVMGAVAVLLAAAAPGALAGMPMALPCCAPAEPPADLTGLSLDQLYNLDIVQPNILGGHTHPAGQTMFGYDYMHTRESGIYQGAHTISPQQAFAEGFATVHIGMNMDMHMFDVMNAPTEWLTLMAMIPYKHMTMQHETSAGTFFTQHDEGFGDLQLMGLWTIFGDIRKGGNRLVLNTGISVPTGAIDERDHKEGDPNKPLAELEYPMQLGSGTWDLMPGLTYLGDWGKWSWGAQTIETLRTGRNYHHYRLGNEYDASAWGSYEVAEWFAPSVRLEFSRFNDIHGADPALAANPTPEARTYLRAGQRLDLLFGLNFYVPGGWLKGLRVTAQGGLPVFQNLKGPQLGTAWTVGGGLTYAF